MNHTINTDSPSLNETSEIAVLSHERRESSASLKYKVVCYSELLMMLSFINTFIQATKQSRLTNQKKVFKRAI